MSGETDLIKLYSARILSLAADIPHLDRLDAPDATAKRRSPLCGSTVTVDLQVKDGRITGFGQDGPYASRPGFATIAEAMSGLSAISGEPDGQPMLPPIARSAFGSLTRTTRCALRAFSARTSDSAAMPTPSSQWLLGSAAERSIRPVLRGVARRRSIAG